MASLTSNFTIGRRALLMGLVASIPADAGGLGTARAAAGSAEPLGPPPNSEFIFEVTLKGGGSPKAGQGPLGSLIPIAGGAFKGPRLRGAVLPGGQLVKRTDGPQQFELRCQLRTDDGAVLAVDVHLLLAFAIGDDPSSSMLCPIEIVAPEGRYGWLDKRPFLGVMEGEGETAIRIRVYALNPRTNPEPDSQRL